MKAMILAGALLFPMQEPGLTPVAKPTNFLEKYPDWSARDAEGRWSLIHADLQRVGAVHEWCVFLGERGEYRLIEWLVLYEPQAWTSSIDVLIAADAPNWMRLAVWKLDIQDSHMFDSAKERLKQHAGAFRFWLTLHPEADTGAAAALSKELGEVPGGSAAHYWPPLSQEEVFGPIEHAQQAVTFGDRTRAVEGEVYVQTVERALMATRTALTRTPAVVDAMIAAASHADPRIGATSILSFSFFLPQQVPVDALVAIASNEDLSLERREAAFLATTYGPQYTVYVELHTLALDPAHHLWRGALSRLSEIGNHFTLKHFENVPRAGLDDAQLAALEGTEAAIRERVPEPFIRTAENVRQLLERAAWVDLKCHPLEASLPQWTFQRLRTDRKNPQTAAILNGLRTYESGPLVQHVRTPGDLEKRVRSYVSRIFGDA